MATAGIPFAPSGAPNAGYGLNVGFPYTGTPVATSGIPNMGGLLVNSSVRPTSSFAVNNFVSVMSHYVCISNPTDEKSKQNCRDLGLGMLVFVRETSLPPMDKNGSRRVRARYDGMSIGPNTAEFKELTMLNEYLADHSMDYSTPEEIIAEWRLMGVIKNEAAPTSVAYGSANYTRMLNLVVSHRVSVLNYWVHSKIIQTQRLYIIVHKNTDGKWQLTPWTSPDRDAPGIADLTSSSGELGAAYYVGKSSDQVYAQFGGRVATPADVTQSLVKRGLMNQVEIYLGI